jgi:hypothetical protein
MSKMNGMILYRKMKEIDDKIKIDLLLSAKQEQDGKQLTTII